MNTKYFIRLLIINSIALAAFSGSTTIDKAYPENIANNNELPDTARPPSFFLVISDIHLNSSASSQSAAQGDSGDSLWEAAKKEIDLLITYKKPRFIIVLGDLPKHDTSTKIDSINVRQNMEQVMAYFKDRAKIPLVYVPGNNDSWNGDYSAFTLPDSIYKMYGYPILHVDSRVASHHACRANDNLLRSLDCFSVYPLGKKNKLKLIILNTVIFTKNKYLPYSIDTLKQPVDANREISWLLQELKRASQNGEQVLIAMHVPPGIDAYTGENMWYDKGIEKTFLKAMEKYQKNIIGLLAGHTHMDGIRLLTTAAHKIDALLISVAGVAPGHGNNPAVKLIKYQEGSFALHDFTTYYMNYWNKCLNVQTDSCEERLTTWSDSFSFTNTAQYNGALSMLQYFQKLQKENRKRHIEQIINKMYSVNGKKQDSSKVNTTIYLDYGE
jgi:sphingomyelin phosphodiesterase acid-like 3